MRAIVTCGPSYEPIDEVRRLTNFSTGELGAILAKALAERGIETVCLRGVGSTFAQPESAVEVRPFTTNDDLARQLEECSSEAEFGALFHAAALCDYRPAGILDATGHELSAAKIPTRAGALTLRLEPAVKILPQLRGWFPRARIYGWKYELNGTPEEARALAEAQIAQNQTDGCILNGRAAGPGFTFIERGGAQQFTSKLELCEFLASRCGAE